MKSNPILPTPGSFFVIAPPRLQVSQLLSGDLSGDLSGEAEDEAGSRRRSGKPKSEDGSQQLIKA
ncbi:MAG: hypothetical protein K9L59_17655 [Desulfobacterales bacterium]|nr:hypothetical protein [Desulfobacterales bacterium]